MKVMWVEFPDTVDPTVLPKGTENVTVGNGDNSLANGKVIAWTDAIDPELPENAEVTFTWKEPEEPESTSE
jgi:hypothetical protein